MFLIGEGTCPSQMFILTTGCVCGSLWADGWGAASGLLVGQVASIEGSKITFFDVQKTEVWLLGIAEAGVLTWLRGRFAWWPFHPAAIAFPVVRYGFSLLLVWLCKLLVIRYGGVQLYRRSLPFWYGIMVGYLFGVGVSHIVDAIWFPEAGHWVHGW